MNLTDKHDIIKLKTIYQKMIYKYKRKEEHLYKQVFT
jgi:hypothetical protein